MLDPYLLAIRSFNRAHVSYIVIGVSGINYYAEDTEQVIMTADYDVFLQPLTTNVANAVKIMLSLGYRIFVAGRARRTFSNPDVEEIVRARNALVCENTEHNLIELCLEISGYTFDELDKNVRLLKAGRDTIRVGSLKDLLRSKMIAGRRKDRTFLDKYADLLDSRS